MCSSDLAALNLAILLRETNRPDEALGHADRAIALSPDLAQAHWLRGRLLDDRGHGVAASVAYARAAELDPESLHIRGALLMARRTNSDWQDDGALERHVLGQIKARAGVLEPFEAMCLEADEDDLRFCAEARAAEIKRQVHVLPAAPLVARPKIRLGYLSCDFRDNAVSHLAVELFELHDRSAFEVIAYS